MPEHLKQKFPNYQNSRISILSFYSVPPALPLLRSCGTSLTIAIMATDWRLFSTLEEIGEDSCKQVKN